MRPLAEVAADLGLSDADLVPFGHDKAKIRLEALRPPAARLILMTGMSPSPPGEGKTTMTIGLADALRRCGHRAVACLRQPSMGPVFGKKGGGSGGGKAQLHPQESINLHFTGDFHAITSAHNLLSAVLDNHLHYDNPLNLDVRRVTWPRVLDVNDRSLRHIVVGMGGAIPREDRFDITPASEVMAILALSSSYEELEHRLSRIVVGFDREGQPVEAARLKAAGAMARLLREALPPNLAQTLEGTPALVHCGPFANIAHGTNSILATRMGMGRSQFVVQEAGFGADLGAEKFIDIFCRELGVFPSLAVVVVTLRALQYQQGYENVRRHQEILRRLGVTRSIVALNRIEGDSDAELAEACRQLDGTCTDVFVQGGAGALELAERVAASAGEPSGQPIYQPEETLEAKLDRIVTEVYGGTRVEYTPRARNELHDYQRLGYGKNYVCVAKTQFSFSDDPRALGSARDFPFHVRAVHLLGGAGFVVPLAGEIMTMPGLPRHPNLEFF